MIFVFLLDNHYSKEDFSLIDKLFNNLDDFLVEPEKTRLYMETCG